MHTIKTMTALAVLEDIANGAIRRKRVFRDREDLLARRGGVAIRMTTELKRTSLQTALHSRAKFMSGPLN